MANQIICIIFAYVTEGHKRTQCQIEAILSIFAYMTFMPRERWAVRLVNGSGFNYPIGSELLIKKEILFQGYIQQILHVAFSGHQREWFLVCMRQIFHLVWDQLWDFPTGRDPLCPFPWVRSLLPNIIVCVCLGQDGKISCSLAGSFGS